MIVITEGGGEGGGWGKDNRPITSLMDGASSYVITVGEALRNRLYLSNPLCHRGEGGGPSPPPRIFRVGV